MAVTGNPPHSQPNADHPKPTELTHPPPHSQTQDTPNAQSSQQSGKITLGSRGRPKKSSLMKQIWKMKKIQTLTDGLNPIPFMPKKINLDKHKDVLKRLCLYEFSKIGLDRNIRTDLLVQLIVNYDSKKRCSFVNEKKVYVNRVNLARALKLPVGKKEKGGLDSGVFSDEAIGFVDDFVFNWLVLHEESWDMPAELVKWTRCVRDGRPEELDSASLVWYKVEKELRQGEKLVDCYYSSHLQCLIRSQQAQLLEEDDGGDEGEGGEVKVSVVREDDVELSLGTDVEKIVQKEVRKDDGIMVNVEECKEDEALKHEEKEEKVSLFQEDDVELSLGLDVEKIVQKEVRKDDGPMVNVEECEEALKHDEKEEKVTLLQEDDVELSLGPDFEKTVQKEVGKDDETMVDVEEYKEVEEQGDWKNFLGEHIIQRCQSSDINDYEDTKVEKGEVEDEEEGAGERFVEGFDIEANDVLMDRDGLTDNFLEGGSSMDTFGSRGDSFMCLAGPSLFDNGGKRVMEPEEDTHHVDGNSKRLKTDEMWDQGPNDFGSCMMQMQQWMEKGKMLLASKEESYVNTKSYQDVAICDLQERHVVMEMMIKSKDKELEQMNYEVFRLERELYLMGDLLQGYRKALNDTRFKFSEYRRRVALQEESVCKDAGHGGLVLSTQELEKQQLKQEDMMKLQTLASMENVSPNANGSKEKVGVEEH